MKVRPIVAYTIAHFAITIVLLFFAFGAVMGLGFKDNWSVSDHVFHFVSVNGAKLLSFPLWKIASKSEPEKLSYLWSPLQLIISFIQANILLFLIQFIRRKRH